MNPVVERQRWLAALALAVAIPLPVTGVVSIPFLVPYVAVAVWVLAARRSLLPLPAWMENLVAPLILAVVVVAGGVRFGVLRPMAQLAILVAAVRLPGCGERRRSKLVGAMISIVGVAGVASSTHPTLALYLVALLGFVLVAVARLTGVELSEGGTGRERALGWPPLRLVAGSVVVAVLVAAPLFALLPRLRSPFAAGPFAGRAASGFREAVALHGIGDVKLSHRLVMRVAFPGVEVGRVSPDWLRLVGATMKHYRAGSWVEGRLQSEHLTSRGGRPVALVSKPAVANLRRVEVVLQREGGNLFAEVGAAAIEMNGSVAVTRDPLGSLRFPRGTELPLSYAVDFDPARVEQPPPDDGDLALPAGSDRLRELARQAAGKTTNTLARALAVEQYLQNNFHYALSVNAPVREDPVQWFLFKSREGHCEFFASSMVLLLRTIGIPARLQAGYAGGEPDGEGGYNVRDSHAHAWVIAYVQGNWRVFDPTPPEGRPGIVEAGESQSLRAAWDRLESKWDRWVLTFSLSDQVDIALGVAEAAARSVPGLVRATPAVILVVALLLLVRRHRKRLPKRIEVAEGAPRITRALMKVVSRATRRGVPIGPGTTAREFGRLASASFPAVADPVGWLVGEHERCRYAGEASPTRRALRQAVRAIESAMAAY